MGAAHHLDVGLLEERRQPLGDLGVVRRRGGDPADAEAIFVSCTNLATYDVIAPLEAELGKPVITANQVTMWAMLEALDRRAVGPHQWLIVGPGSSREDS